MGKFGGFATDSCRQAILTLKTFYRDHGGDPQDYMLRRRDLYKIFKQKLDAKFGKEHTDIIPASLAVKQVKLMRKSLFYSGYSLSMTHILNEKPLPPTPFYPWTRENPVLQVWDESRLFLILPVRYACSHCGKTQSEYKLL